jgi:riboflavin kinase/FMN adenylyltransferase
MQKAADWAFTSNGKCSRVSLMFRATQAADLAGLPMPLHLALGVFDGVHLGHQSVIASAMEASTRHGGSSVVVTFEPHPIRVLSPERAPRQLLASLDHKCRLLQRMGVNAVLALPFDAALATMSAEAFCSLLLQAGNLATIAVGEDWRFGRGREGDVAFLRHCGNAHGIGIHALPPIMHEGERISSTRIRQSIRDGALINAASMLGRPYGVEGMVVKGQQLGRTIGFPTANLALHNEQLPPDGVWIVEVCSESERWHGVANLGVRPTIGDSVRSLEVHLFDMSADLYGKILEVEFLQHLRPEKKFEHLDALKDQIARDAATARDWLNARGYPKKL